MTHKNRRVGLIVPSSNVTMETEIPALLRNREEIFSDRFTFHSSRMRMKSVVKEELERMDDDSVRCAFELWMRCPALRTIYGTINWVS